MGNHYGVIGGRDIGQRDVRRFPARGGSCLFGDAESVNDILVPYLILLRVLDSSHRLGILRIRSLRIKITTLSPYMGGAGGLSAL
jgi:hypothetical protein